MYILSKKNYLKLCKQEKSRFKANKVSKFFVDWTKCYIASKEVFLIPTLFFYTSILYVYYVS